MPPVISKHGNSRRHASRSDLADIQFQFELWKIDIEKLKELNLIPVHTNHLFSIHGITPRHDGRT